MSASSTSASRHPLIVGTRWLLPIAIVLALAAAAAAHALPAKLLAGFFALLGVVAWRWQERHRPTLLLDDDGYAIEQEGKEKLRVAWSEVHKVRIDKRESAVYVDCGDKARNLFVPPGRGYGFRFADAEAVCARARRSAGRARRRGRAHRCSLTRRCAISATAIRACARRRRMRSAASIPPTTTRR